MTPKRSCRGLVKQPRAGGGADQRERLDVELNALGVRAVAHHHVDAKVLDRRVQRFFDGRAQAMNLVDEQDVGARHARQKPGEHALVLHRRAAGHEQLRAHLFGQDVRQRRLAQAGRTAQQDVVERLFTPPRGLDVHAQVLLVLLLADELVQRAGPKDAIEALFFTEHAARRQACRHGLTVGGLGKGR